MFFCENNINCIISEDINIDAEVIKLISKQTLGISFGAAWIFKKKFINYFEGKLINSHGTRLPQDRGAGGFSWRILRGERLGFSLLHQIASGVDTGNIIKYEEYFYPSSCKVPIDYQNYSIERYLVLFDNFIKDIKEGKSFELEMEESNIQITSSSSQEKDLNIAEFISLKEAKFDADAGTIEIVIIEAGFNPQKKRLYPDSTVRESAGIFAGMKHPHSLQNLVILLRCLHREQILALFFTNGVFLYLWVIKLVHPSIILVDFLIICLFF